MADYVDQNDHDLLRSDPIFKLLCGRSIHGEDLASQPQRLFTAFWYRADSWPTQRWVVVKCEALTHVTATPPITPTKTPASQPATRQTISLGE